MGPLLPRRQFFDDPMAHGILGLYEANKIRIGHEDAKHSLAMDQEEAAIFEALLPPPRQRRGHRFAQSISRSRRTAGATGFLILSH